MVRLALLALTCLTSCTVVFAGVGAMGASNDEDEPRREASYTTHAEVEACKAERVRIFAEAEKIDDLHERARRFRTLPTCSSDPDETNRRPSKERSSGMAVLVGIGLVIDAALVYTFMQECCRFAPSK